LKKSLDIKLEKEILKIDNTANIIVDDAIQKICNNQKLFELYNAADTDDDLMVPVLNFKNIKIAKRLFEKDHKLINSALKNMLKEVKNER